MHPRFLTEWSANGLKSTIQQPITEPRVYRDGRLVAGRGTGVALVNRYSIRRIHQVDAVN